MNTKTYVFMEKLEYMYISTLWLKKELISGCYLQQI